VILFTCIAEISTVDEEPIFRILLLKLSFFQHCKKKNKKKRTNKIPKSETITEKNKRKSKLEVVIKRRTSQFLIE
jgi:hypothetical protein